MADQVHTDALPSEADATPDEAFELGEVHGYDKGYADGIRGAADEVGRLRDEVAEWKSYAEGQKRHWQVENTNRKAAEDELMRLQDLIDAAPHDDLCKAANGWAAVECDCWKADAL